MNWQGIPFRILRDVSEALDLNITALPSVVLKSDPDYTSLILTAGVSLLAGLIPAGIAIYTFRRNSLNLSREREEQQNFLKKEREEQQIFLREERAAQAASIEADRILQKDIAERNFNMQVLSVNRQAWINKLRDYLSEYMALAPDFLTAQYNFISQKKYYYQVAEKRNSIFSMQLNSEKINSEYEKASKSLNEAVSKINDYRIKEKLLTGNIKLMLNPSEKWYPQLMSVFGEVIIIFNSLQETEQDIYMEKIKQMNAQVDICLSVSQDLLKYEWERVKKGE